MGQSIGSVAERRALAASSVLKPGSDLSGQHLCKLGLQAARDKGGQTAAAHRGGLECGDRCCLAWRRS